MTVIYQLLKILRDLSVSYVEGLYWIKELELVGWRDMPLSDMKTLSNLDTVRVGIVSFTESFQEGNRPGDKILEYYYNDGTSTFCTEKAIIRGDNLMSTSSALFNNNDFFNH